MKKFLIKLSVFGAIYLVIVCTFFLLSAQDKWSMAIADITKSGEYAYEDFGANEIMPYIERVQEQNTYSKLIIGDSVCHQIFERYYEMNDIYCISGTNQAISIAGQYILAKEFVKSHEDITDIYLVVTMGSLATDFGTKLGYQYAVMPFVKTDTIDNLSENTRKRIADVYGGFFCQKPLVEMNYKSPLCMKMYLNMLVEKEKKFPNKSDGLISQPTYEYLEKLSLLCEEEGITLHLIPPPHADTEGRHEIEKKLRNRLEIEGDKIGLEAYLDKVFYYPEGMFHDGIHFDEKELEDTFFPELAKELVPEINVE